ncbi:hypothetical protein DBR42_15380 [Pelomonas sp. HMWF004]|nr:hypothetical protein DBR42_15380 [Pelomonas sp. HMWF004]
MNPSPIATRALKAIVLMIAGLGSLAAALMVAFLTTALSGLVTSVHALTALMGLMTLLATLAALAVLMKRLTWRWRAAVGVLLLAGSFMLLPRHGCGPELPARTGC